MLTIISRHKSFLSEVQQGIVPDTWWRHSDAGNNQEAKKEVIELFGDSEPFSTPKPTKLTNRMIQIATSKDSSDIVMDFFAGSGTTAHSVFYSNGKGGNQRFILVQLPEKTANNDYQTIADICKERIRRAGDKILEENKDQESIENLDIGFKVFKLDSSNIKAWDADFDNLQQSLIDAVHNIKEDRTEEDVLYELLLKYGLDLTLPIEDRSIAGKTVYSIGFGALVICLDSDITLEVVEGIGKLKDELEPEIMRVVFRDSGFKDDVVKTNAIQILKRYDITDVKSL